MGGGCFPFVLVIDEIISVDWEKVRGEIYASSNGYNLHFCTSLKLEDYVPNFIEKTQDFGGE